MSSPSPTSPTMTKLIELLSALLSGLSYSESCSSVSFSYVPIASLFAGVQGGVASRFLFCNKERPLVPGSIVCQQFSALELYYNMTACQRSFHHYLAPKEVGNALSFYNSGK